MRPEPNQLFMRRVAFYLNGLERLFFPARRVFNAWASELEGDEGERLWGVEVWVFANNAMITWERSGEEWKGWVYDDPRTGPHGGQDEPSEEGEESDQFGLTFPKPSEENPKAAARSIYDAIEEYLKEWSESKGGLT